MSRRISTKIIGVSGYVPPRVMTNADLGKLVETDDAWIRERTGIRERHVVEKGVGASDLATAAARRVLADKNVPASEIDLIVVASVTPDMMFPATACIVQNNLQAKHAWGFDLSAACSGFLYALTVGAQFVGAGTQKKALVIGSDVMTSILDYGDRTTCVLFGDGAGAARNYEKECCRDSRSEEARRHWERTQYRRYAAVNVWRLGSSTVCNEGSSRPRIRNTGAAKARAMPSMQYAAAKKTLPHRRIVASMHVSSALPHMLNHMRKPLPVARA